MTSMETLGGLFLVILTISYITIAAGHLSITRRVRWYHWPFLGAVMTIGCFVLYCIGSYLRYLWEVLL